jgi:hypothetical protein
MLFEYNQKYEIVPDTYSGLNEWYCEHQCDFSNSSSKRLGLPSNWDLP